MKTIELKWIEDDNHVVAEDAYTGLKELIETGVFPNLEVECKDDTLYITGEKEDLDKAVMKIQKAYAQYGQIMIKEAKSGETGLRIESFDDNVQDIFNHTLADYQTFKESTKGSNKPANYITTLGDFQLKFKKFKDTAKGKDKKYMDGFLKEIAELSENYEPVKIKPIKKIDEGKLIDADALNVMMELIDLGYQSEAASRLIKKYTNFINKELKDGAKPYWIAKMIEDDMVNQQFSDKEDDKEVDEVDESTKINEDSLDDMIDNTGHDPERIATKGFSGYIPVRYTDCCFTFITKNWRDMEKYGLPSHPVFFPRDPEDIDRMTHTYLNFKQTLKLFDKVPDKILKVTPRQRNGWSFGNVDGDYVSKDAWIAFAKKFLGIEPPSPKPRKPRDPNKGYKKPDYVNPDMKGGTYFDGDTQVYEMPEENEAFMIKTAKEICEAAGKKVINPETIDTCDDVEEELQKLGYGPAVSRALVKDNLSQIIRLLGNGNSAEDVAFVLDKQYMNEDANNDVRKHLSNPRNWGIIEESLLSPSELKKKLTRVAAKWAYETGKSYEEAFNELRKKKSVKDMLDYYSVEEIIDDLKKKKKEVDDELEEEI